MRSDHLYLEDIIAAADAIQRFIAAPIDEASFHEDELRQSAVLQKLIVIGEAATRLSLDSQRFSRSVFFALFAAILACLVLRVACYVSRVTSDE